VKGTQRYWTSAIIVGLIVVGLVVGLFATGTKPKLGLDLSGGLSVTLTAPVHTSAAKMDEAVLIIQNRINRLGVTGASVSREGSNNVVVAVPNAKNPQQIVNLVGETAQLEFRQVQAQWTAGSQPPTATVTPYYPTETAQTVFFKGAGQVSGTIFQLAPAALTGAGISSAAAVVDQNGNWDVDLSFKSSAVKTWSSFTGQMACLNATSQATQREIGIVLDGVVQSAPELNSSVQCGTGLTSTQITGLNGQTEAKNLALVLQTGALPVTLKKSTVNEVSATLGHQSLDAGLIAGALGLALVLIYVAVYYRSLGLQTWVGLCAFAGLTYSLVVILGNTIGLSLSLAGIAGLIVSIGITTDSYVVFFERIKEEVHEAKTLRSSVDRGYKSALRTLFTADAITFFAAVILYIFAVSDVRGFAFTLGMATALDVFLFLALTYPLAAILARTQIFSKGRLLGMTTAFEGTGQSGWRRKVYRSDFHINFVGRRKMWLTISGVAVAISVAALIPGVRGLKFGIDFKGGTQFTVPVTSSVTVDEIKSAVAKAGVTPQQVVIASQIGSKNHNAQVETNNLTNNTDAQTKVVDALAAVAHTDTSSVSTNSIGASWGSQITTKALEGLIIFLVVVVLYMAWRLETKMAGAGLIALFHDLLITGGVYAIAGLQVTPDTVIAILTILGYSLYDTVVVFDKIKENVVLPSNAKKPYDVIANDSMNQVFMRSINTSLTTLLPVGSLLFVGSFLLGADTLRELALALFVGIASGTYSSIFVATPLLSIFKEGEPRYASLKAASLRRSAGLAGAAAGSPAAAAAVDSDLTEQEQPARRPAAGRPAAARPGTARQLSSGRPGTAAARRPPAAKARPAVKAGSQAGAGESAPSRPAAGAGSTLAGESNGQAASGGEAASGDGAGVGAGTKPAARGGPQPRRSQPQRKPARAKRKKGGR
jgi:protein-export membrane protein SecD/preprotein translocase SecF subunit